MKANIEQYLNAAGAARRTERQISQQEAAWDRWVARAQLAYRLGEERLAAAAHRRALMHGEVAIWLRAVYAKQDALVRHLADRIRTERGGI